jgi:hypothetical protein
MQLLAVVTRQSNSWAMNESFFKLQCFTFCFAFLPNSKFTLLKSKVIMGCQDLIA